MADSPRQHAGSHARFLPIYHFVALPITWAYAFFVTWRAIEAMTLDAFGWAVYAWGVAVAVLASRVMALTVQDRLIRLEETLRMQRVLPAGMQGDIAKLGRRQFVALRFASDEELPDLVRRTVAGELADQKAIKAAIRNWRADWLRA
jgi:hypothetical protein